jgi:hypothetical protein
MVYGTKRGDRKGEGRKRMDQPQPGERPTNFDVQVSPELEGGAYANFLTVWHTGYEFTLDFAVIQPAIPQDPQDPTSSLTVPCRVVARVKIPPTLIFDIMRALNENMTTYESVFGEIPRLEPTQEDTE